MMERERASQREGIWLVKVALVSVACFVASNVGAQVTSVHGEARVTADARVSTASSDEQAQARDQQARYLFEAGRQAYVEEKYQDALNYFDQAHALSPRPQLLFNIGQAADRLGQRERASRSFRAYLSALPDAPNREEIETRIAELEASSTPSGDETLISDGRGPRARVYLRGAIGVGVARDAFSRTVSTGLPRLEGNASGGSFALELAAGHALRPGLALAGFLALEWAQADTIEVEGVEISDGQVGLLGMLGAMIDWYVIPSGGAHVQAGLALARMPVKGGDSDVVDHESVGGALIIGGGYEWTLHRGLALGVLGRLTLSQLKGDDFTHNVQALSVLASLSMF